MRTCSHDERLLRRSQAQDSLLGVVGRKTFDFNDDGLAHVGMLPDLIADFQAMGLSQADLDPLLNSADGYVTLWEKAWRRSVRSTGALSYTATSSVVDIWTRCRVPWGASVSRKPPDAAIQHFRRPEPAYIPEILEKKILR